MSVITPGRTVPWLTALLVRWPEGEVTAPSEDLLRELARAGVRVRWFGRPDEAGPSGTLPPVDRVTVSAELAHLADQGIGPGLVGAVGRLPGLSPSVRRLPGGADGIDEAVRAQLELRRLRRVPDVDRDPSWTIVVTGTDDVLERVEEALCTLADGRFGTRGALEDADDGADPLVVTAGIFTAGTGAGLDATPTLLPGPWWTRLVLPGAEARTTRRTLDLRAGLLLRETDAGAGVRCLRLVSLARPGLCLLRAEGPSSALDAGTTLRLPPDTPEGRIHQLDWGSWALTRGTAGWIGAAGRTETTEDGDRRVVERRVVLSRGEDPPPDPDAGRRQLQTTADLDFEELLEEHRARWAERWRHADVVIEDEPALQQAVRFGLFHLMASVADRGEAAVGARGMTGRAYRGHVFWDADVFVLPFLAATHPPAARAMLAYRLARLPAARALAAATGHAGARFPWESADTGDEVAPTAAIDFAGRPVEIRTGQYQEHVTADVAWAAAHFVDWTGDRAFERGAGRRLWLETARYWRTRLTRGEDGRLHLRAVMGPDEYHWPVDDNAFTNAMVRWNLRRAAAAIGAGDVPGLVREAVAWRRAALELVDGYDPATGRHEQFDGYDRLEPLVITELADVPVAADVLLGHDRVRTSQVVKQADVLMRHHLLRREAPPGSLEADLDHYLPRTAHGSSLSPGVHAALLARAGRPDEALAWLRLSARIDLDDLTGTTAGGLHLATAGSVWQALVHGFLGVWPESDGTLAVTPRLPADWDAVVVHLRHRGLPVELRAGHRRLAITTPHPLRIRLGGRRHVTDPGTTGFRWQAGTWRITRR